jgi:hypothetical protein
MEPSIKMRKREIITVKVEKMPKGKSYRERFNSDDNMMINEQSKFLRTRQNTDIRVESTGGSRKHMNYFD